MPYFTSMCNCMCWWEWKMLQSLLLPNVEHTAKFYFTTKLLKKATPGCKERFKIELIKVSLACASWNYIFSEMLLVSDDMEIGLCWHQKRLNPTDIGYWPGREAIIQVNSNQIQILNPPSDLHCFLSLQGVHVSILTCLTMHYLNVYILNTSKCKWVPGYLQTAAVIASLSCGFKCHSLELSEI